ncbi:hypothetical protein M9Y10_018530 [Tritrichomonas musculus]|uniref:DUF3447 domain-containing protein n=1 Tax=Tritrichomonas musculus TaxID=1915356 RepID=A0ABR2HNQ9_9EUKA
MNYEEYIEKMLIIQQIIEKYIDIEEDEYRENYYLTSLFTKEQILEDRSLLKSILYILSKITKNHYHNSHFQCKIRKIFQSIKSYIISTFSNSEIFNIFKNQKLILLILIEEKIISIESFFHFIRKIKYINLHYPEFFYPEIKKFINESMIQYILKILPQNYEDLREIGENEDFICKLIREDSIQDFIIFINKTNYPLNSHIKTSIFETNSFLLKKEPTIVEYAAFFGSIQILNYLFLKNVSFSPSLWLYGIHSNNPELIGFLEEKCIKPKDETYEECLKESIKCHHNEIADYFLNNYIKEIDQDNFDNNIYSYGFHYRNFLYFPKNQNYKFMFYYACQYDYFNIVKNFLNNKNFDINDEIIKALLLNNILL